MKNKIKAKELEVGTVFCYNNKFYLVIWDVVMEEKNFVCLTDFTAAPCEDYFFENENVQVINNYK